MRFFSEIEGLRAEQLTTAILAYILVSPRFTVYRNVFLSHLFPGVPFSKFHDGDYEIETEFDLQQYGRADLILANEESLIILENKFYAEFTAGDQIKRYADFLKQDDRQTKILCLISLAERERYYLKQIADMFRLSESSAAAINQYLSPNGIRFVFIPWETMLAVFQSDNIIIEELKHYIYHNYLTDTTLTEAERTMLSTDTIPVLMEKIWNTIDKVKTHLSSDGYVTKRTTQSRTFYAFAVAETWGDIWVDYYHGPWIKYGTPFVLQFRERDIGKAYSRKVPEVVQNLLSAGFLKDDDLEFVYPIKITSVDLVSEVLSATRNKLKELRSIMPELGVNPGETRAE